MAQLFYIVLFGLIIQTIRSSFIKEFDENLKSNSGNDSFITIVTNAHSGPFLSLASYGVPYGFDVKIMDTISLITGYKFRYEYAPFDKLVSIVQADPIKVSISTEFSTAQRRKSVDFVTYFQTGSAFIVLSSSTSNINGLSDLCGMKVVVLAGSSQEQNVQKEAKSCPQSIDIISVSSYIDLTETVASGSADVGLGDEAVLVASVSESKNKLKLVGKP